MQSPPSSFSKYRVLRCTVRFFLQKNGRFFCVNGAGSVAMLQHLVPERIPIRKLRENMFFGVRTAVDETSLGQFVAVYGACRTISWYKWTHYVRNNRRPKFDQIRARAR